MQAHGSNGSFDSPCSMSGRLAPLCQVERPLISDGASFPTLNSLGNNKEGPVTRTTKKVMFFNALCRQHHRP